MGKRALGDPEIYPSDEVLAAHLGRAAAAFTSFQACMRASCPDIEELYKELLAIKLASR